MVGGRWTVDRGWWTVDGREHQISIRAAAKPRPMYRGPWPLNRER